MQDDLERYIAESIAADPAFADDLARAERALDERAQPAKGEK